MRRVVYVVIVICAASVLRPAALRADVLEVIPESSLAAVVARSADGFQDSMQTMVFELTGDKRLGGGHVKDVLRTFGLRGGRVRRLREDEKDQPPRRVKTIDLKGPMALVVVAPAMDQGPPNALVVKVPDYRKFLQEYADILGAAGPEVSVDGTDMLKADRKTFFVSRLGAYVVIAQAEYVITTFRAEQNRNLAVSDVGEIKRLYARNDLVVYADLDGVVRTFGSQIGFFRKRILRGVRQGMQNQQGMDAEKMADFYGTLIDGIVAFGKQSDAVCAGLKFGAGGASAEAILQPVKGTQCARVVSKFKPMTTPGLHVLNRADIAAGEWHADPQIMNGLVRAVGRMVSVMGLFEDDHARNAFMKRYRDAVNTLKGPGAFTWVTPKNDRGQGVLRFIEVFDVKSGTNALAALREYAAEMENKMGAMKLPVRMKMTVTEGAETWRGCTIDRLGTGFPLAVDTETTRQMQEMIRAFYGAELVQYTAVAGDKLIITVGYAKTDAIRTVIDRVLDGKKRGGADSSMMWREARGQLPAKCTAVLAVSPSVMLRTFVPPAMKAGLPREEGDLVQPGTVRMKAMAEALEKVTFEKPSAVGASFGPSAKGLAIHVNVPVQEMKNLKQVFETVRKADPAAKRTRSINNLRMIGFACHAYARDYDGNFPPDFETLLFKGRYLTSPKVLIAPGSGDAVGADYPKDMKNATREQLKLGPKNCSYVLVAKPRTDDLADAILVYEKKPFFAERRNVCFVDCHVESVPEKRFQKLLASEKEKRTE